MAKPLPETGDILAGGLLHRRQVLGLAAAGASLLSPAAAAATRDLPPWLTTPGAGPSGYGAPTTALPPLQRKVTRTSSLYPGGGVSLTPLDRLAGTITPNSLHFERHHAGIPAIDPERHELLIHGLVERPLRFRYEDLLQYPMTSRLYFIECAGNSRALAAAVPVSGSAQDLHGMLSTSEWTGIRLSGLLDEAGVAPGATWLRAVGADAASMARSLPLAKAMDDVLLALYQNGEPLRPEQGFPMRLVVPGWEGNINIKWLSELEVSASPAHFREETSKYTEVLPDGRSAQFTFPMGCKSVITSPSGGQRLTRRGLYQVTGLAWSGSGRITGVELSSDGGQSWTDAIIESTPGDRAPVRFRGAWSWEGQRAVLTSRARDDRGNLQPSRAEFLARAGSFGNYHVNCSQCWGIGNDGSVGNVYA